MSKIKITLALMFIFLVAHGIIADARSPTKEAKAAIKLAEKAEKNEELHVASSHYLLALEIEGAKLRKNQLKKTKEGLARTSQVVLDDMIAETEIVVSEQDYKKAILAHKESWAFISRISKLGVELNWPAEKLSSLHQTALNEIVKGVEISISKKNYNEAILAHQGSGNYIDEISKSGVELNWPAEVLTNLHQSVFNEIVKKAETALQNKDEALTLKHHKTAKDYLHKISSTRGVGSIKLNWPPNAKLHRGVELIIASRQYRQGLRSIERKNYREAYRLFNSALVSGFSQYSDAKKQKEEALKVGQQKVGIFHFINNSDVPGINTPIRTGVLKKIVQNDDPFLFFVRGKNLSQLLSERAHGSPSIVDAHTASTAGKAMGLDSVVLVEIHEAIQDKSTNIVQQYHGFEVRGKRGSLFGSPVTVKVHEESHMFKIACQVQIVSTKTSELLASKQLQATYDDKVVYADCGGCNYDRLSQKDPSIYNPNNLDNAALDEATESLGATAQLVTGIAKLFAGRGKMPPEWKPVNSGLITNKPRPLKSVFELRSKVQNDLAEQISVELLGYYGEK